MTEIFNLHTLCRCCHSDGSFKSLQLPYSYETRVEVYATMLQKTFDVTINPAPFEASYAICDLCILKLREAACFKAQVLECEQKFEVYCKNEQSLIVKEEVDFDYGSDLERDDVNTKSQCIDDEKYSKDFKNPTQYPEETKVKHDCAVDEKFCVKVKIKDEIKEDIRKVNTETVPIEYDPPIDKTSVVIDKRTSSKIVKAQPKRSKERICLDAEFESRTETDGVIAYMCKVCDEKFKLLKDLRTHIGNCHQHVYKCQICSTQCLTRVTYHRHMKVHEQNDLNCQYCGKRFKSKNSLNLHENSHTQEEKFQCDLCQKFFAYKQTLKKHLLWHYGVNKTCMCDICGHVFNDRSNLKCHVQVVHEKLRPFKCEVCSKAFTAKKHLRHHSYSHTGEKPYKCEMCFSQFSTPWQLKHHQFKKHTDGPEPRVKFYTCKVCCLKVATRAKFMVHLKTHIGQREYKCHLCPKDFTCKYSLSRHINEHSGLKAFSCDLCSKSYTQQSKLSRHKKRIHDPNSDFYRLTEKTKCDVCNKSFTDIKKHLKSHSMRPHVCEICHKSYPERNTLNRHVLYVHHGMKPFPCTMCQKRYAKWQVLQKHMRRIHKFELKREVKES